MKTKEQDFMDTRELIRAQIAEHSQAIQVLRKFEDFFNNPQNLWDRDIENQLVTLAKRSATAGVGAAGIVMTIRGALEAQRARQS